MPIHLLSRVVRSLVRFKALALLFAATLAGTAHAQTTGTMAVTGGGTLSFQEVAQRVPCNAQNFFTQTLYSNFVYLTPSGTSIPLTGSDYSIDVTGSNCPPQSQPFTKLLMGQGYTITFNPDGVAILSSASVYLYPKYVVMGVTYAPPGPSSYVEYTSGTFLGSTKTISNSFNEGTSLTVSVGGQAGIPFIFSTKLTATSTTSYSQTSASSTAITMSSQTQVTNHTTGTPNAYSPINHDYDTIWLWLNPVVLLSANPNTPSVLSWDGYGVDEDDQPALDIWPVQVGWLNGHFGATLDPGDANELNRSWANNLYSWPAGDGPALNATDYANILLSDPFADPSYSVDIIPGSNPATTLDGRFTISSPNGSAAQSFIYKQADPGETASNQTLTNTYNNTNVQTSGNTYTTQQTFGLDVATKTGAIFVKIGTDFKLSQNLTWTHQKNLAITNTSTDIDKLSITGPPCVATTFPCVPTYTGNSEFDVYQDNIYGTFMFNGVN
jgi:hypothetical protein